jgi:hypothetical protein
VLAGVWVEVVALVAAFAIAVVTTPAGSPARCCCCHFRSASWPEKLIRRLFALIVVAIGIRFLVAGLAATL